MVSGRFFAIAAGKTALSAQILTAFALELPSGAVFLQSRQLSASPGAGQCTDGARMVQVGAVSGTGQYTDGAGQCGLWRRRAGWMAQVSFGVGNLRR